jgi:hypothetical protein
MNVKPSIGFLTKDGQASFTDKVTTILQWMTGNANYPTPSPTLTVVQTAFNAYKVATADASQGGVENTAIRDARRAELVSLLRQLANYVGATANGDLEKLMSSGFPVQKSTRTPIGPLPAPQAPFLRQGPVSGSARASAPPVYGAALYTARLALASAPTTYLKTQQSTGARFRFENLTPGEVYSVDINAIGAAGPSDWSDVGTARVI